MRKTCLAALIALLLVFPMSHVTASGDVDITIEAWHSFAAESKEEATFLSAIADFEQSHPHISVEVTAIPFGDADQLFLTAAQGGEAPDLVRLSSDQLGKIGEVRVDGFPLLEDLRPHLTPAERDIFDHQALQAMRYGDALYGVPASQDCLSLLYNRALFDAQGISYPNENWTTDDFLSAAQSLTTGGVHGLAIPVKVAYWWFPWQTGFGGSLFNESGEPTLDSNGSAAALDWVISLEQEHEVVSTGTQIETMESQFIQSQAAMIVDGPWNWATYEASRLDVGQTLLPIVEDTGLRSSPLVTYKGWSISKQSTQKIAATQLALHLSSPTVQKAFALETTTMPTAVDTANDVEVQADPVLAGFLAQAEVATPAPTTREMSLVYGPLSTAFEQVHANIASAEDALSGADEEMDVLISGQSTSEPFPLEPGYRTITIEVDTDVSAMTYIVKVDDIQHSILYSGVGEFTPESGEWYDDCWADGSPIPRSENGVAMVPTTAGNWSCSLTGMYPDVLHLIQVYADYGGDALPVLIAEFNFTTTVADVLPPSPDTSPVLFAIGSIALSLIALLSYLRWRDAREGKHRGKLAHFYIAPALLSLAILTFYPVIYGIWLSFTDADQTHLGEQAWVGFANFVAVLQSSGFIRVTIFTLVWTICNVIAHVALGLALALILDNPHIKGRTAYRTALLLPWAIPSYISVLVWKGILQPEGMVNDLLGTDLDLLSDASGAKMLVILVNIWLGVPFMMMSLSGAIQALPREMYEAAEVDGVNSWHQFRHLTLPNLKSAIVPLSLLGFIWTFNMFNVIYLMTDGGPDLRFGEPGETDILITYVYDVAFRDGAYGVAAAWSVVIFLMLVAFSWVYMKRTNATEASA
ncbi:MAG: extracellular solute-binding protein [Candidatus Thalassarchaeaceae archaeon]|jgi:arabinogalactan oligomer/maltooligosaccharide transport system permease protein|nr:extracellular solute-binding protein [Candidatus Thalassarchaeaceae archaeon]